MSMGWRGLSALDETGEGISLFPLGADWTTVHACMPAHMSVLGCMAATGCWCGQPGMHASANITPGMHAASKLHLLS